MRLSARNQIPATVTAITMGEATANIALDAGGVRLVASITVEAARELGLAEGTQVTAVIKASDVIVAVRLSSGGRPPVPPDVGAGGPDRKNRDLIRPARTDEKNCAPLLLPHDRADKGCETSLKSRGPRPGWIHSLRGQPLSLSDGDYLPIGHGH